MIHIKQRIIMNKTIFLRKIILSDIKISKCSISNIVVKRTISKSMKKHLAEERSRSIEIVFIKEKETLIENVY